MRKFWFIYLAKALVVFPGGFGHRNDVFVDDHFAVVAVLDSSTLSLSVPAVYYDIDSQQPGQASPLQIRSRMEAGFGADFGEVLLAGRRPELVGRHRHRRDPQALQLCRVVQTARCARASVSERFDDSVAPGLDQSIDDFARRRFGKGGFARPHHRLHGAQDLHS